MTRWKESSTKRYTQRSSSLRKGFTLSKRSSEKKETEEGEEEDIEIHNDNASFDTTLLFPKEYKDKDPLFPDLVASSYKKSFVMMFCKRTVFACRGLLLFCVVLFLIVSFAASNSSSSSGSGSDSEGYGGGYGRDDEESNSSSSSSSAPEAKTELGHDINAIKRYENVSLVLPIPVKGLGGNLSDVKVTFNAKCGYTKTSFALIGNALRRALDFYERNLKDITVLDAALGTKIVAEQLDQALERHPKLPRPIRNFLNELEKKSRTLTQQITTTVRLTTDNVKSLKYTLPWIEIEGLWNLPQNGDWHPLGALKEYDPPFGQEFEDLWNVVSRGEVIDENESDACIYQVFHCDTTGITRRCRSVFLDVERSMYSLTHQVIYMLLLRKNRCYEQPTWRRVPVLEDRGNSFLEQLCGRVWQEANSIAEAEFPPRFRDLFIEQIGMCSLAGYTDFLSRVWLRRIISWQSISESGCFGEKGRRRVPAYPNVATVLRDYQSQEQEYYSSQQTGTDYKYYNPRPSVYDNGRHRRKRSDVFVQDGDNRDKCSVHFTSVGITALSIHLRYFIDSCLDSY